MASCLLNTQACLTHFAVPICMDPSYQFNETTPVTQQQGSSVSHHSRVKKQFSPLCEWQTHHDPRPITSFLPKSVGWVGGHCICYFTQTMCGVVLPPHPVINPSETFKWTTERGNWPTKMEVQQTNWNVVMLEVKTEWCSQTVDLLP